MPSRADNLIRQKSMDYAVRIYHLNEYLIQQKKFTLADQVFRSGTSIGANISEAIKAESDADFVHKHSIALKEAEETLYWLELAYRVDLLEEKLYKSLQADCLEIIKLGTSITLTMLRKIKAAKQE
jgi:four helix bundle protein